MNHRQEDNDTGNVDMDYSHADMDPVSDNRNCLQTYTLVHGLVIPSSGRYMDTKLLDNDDGYADMGHSHAHMDPICDDIYDKYTCRYGPYTDR